MYGQNNNKSELFDSGLENSSPTTPSEGEADVVEKLYCEKCDTTYEEDYEFCPECGEKLTVKIEPVKTTQKDADQDTIKCPNCGFEASSRFVFCPECGKPLNKGTSALGQTETQRMHAQDESPSQGNSKMDSYSQEDKHSPQTSSATPKKSSKKWVILGVLVAAAIIVIIFLNMTSPKTLILNSGDDIDIYVGDTKKVEVVGDGLDAVDYQSIILYPDNEEVLNVGEITAK